MLWLFFFLFFVFLVGQPVVIKKCDKPQKCTESCLPCYVQIGHPNIIKRTKGRSVYRETWNLLELQAGKKGASITYRTVEGIVLIHASTQLMDLGHWNGKFEFVYDRKVELPLWTRRCWPSSIFIGSVESFFFFSFSLNLWLVIQRIDSYRNKSNIIKWNVAEATESQLHSFFFLERGFGRLFIVRMIKRMGLDSTRLDSALILRTFT